MLSVNDCRKIIGDSTLCDREVESLRDRLGVIADLAIDDYLSEDSFQQRETIRGLGDVERYLNSDELYDLRERASIQEIDGGLEQDEADRAAVVSIVERTGGRPCPKQ